MARECRSCSNLERIRQEASKKTLYLVDSIAGLSEYDTEQEAKDYIRAVLRQGYGYDITLYKVLKKEITYGP